MAPYKLYGTLPQWRLQGTCSNGSAKYAFRFAMLLVSFVLLGIFMSQIYASSKTDILGSGRKPEPPTSTPVNYGKIHGDNHDAFKEQEQPPTPQPPADAVPQDPPPVPPLPPPAPEAVAPAATNDAPPSIDKPWYWRVADRFRGMHGPPSQSTTDHPAHPSMPDAAPPPRLNPALPDERIEYPPSTDSDHPYLAKVTVNIPSGSDFTDTYIRALKTHVVQNKIHNYAMYTLSYSLTTMKEQMWSKPAYLLLIMLREMAKPPEDRLSWLFWVDADTLVLNPNIPVETFLPPLDLSDIHLLVSNDFNGLNNGVFLLRVCIWSIDFLAAVVSYPHYNPDQQLQFQEQSAMELLLKDSRFGRHAAYLPQRWFNAYPGETKEILEPYKNRHGDMMIHFAGPGKTSLMQRWLDRIDLHDPEWEIPLRQTGYPTEVKEYWESFRDQAKANDTKSEKAFTVANQLVEDVQVYLKEFEGDLNDTRMASVNEAIRAILDLGEHDNRKHDVELVRQCTQELKHAAEPLISHARKANRVLYQEAHGLLLRFEEESKDREEVPDATLAAYDDFVDRLSELRKLLMDSKADPRALERAIAEINQARDTFKSKTPDNGAANAVIDVTDEDEEIIDNAQVGDPTSKDSEGPADENSGGDENKDEEHVTSSNTGNLNGTFTSGTSGNESNPK